jgi:uncharacterized membrane-anchored protein
MTSLLGWAIIVLTFGCISMGLVYPIYRVARRSHPESRHLRWIYGVAAAVCGMALWLLLPLIVHRLFGHVAA